MEAPRARAAWAEKATQSRTAIVLRVACALALAWWCAAAESDSAASDPFFAQYESKYRAEYRECTGDTSNMSIKRIIAWREHVNEVTKKPEYRILLREFIEKTGRVQDARPCIVIKWHEERRAKVDEEEEAVAAAQVESDAQTVDSVVVAENLQGNPLSPFDIGTIPFGVTRPALRWLFKRQFGLPLTEMRSYVYAADFMLDGRPFLVAFHFNSDDRLVRYEVEGPDCSADSLNQLARPEAKFLAEAYERKLGPPTSSHRIGQFDIKPDKLSPLSRWYKKPYSANVGLSCHKYRYYAKAIVVREELAPLRSTGNK